MILLIIALQAGCGSLPPAHSQASDRIVYYARSLVGKPYRYGGNTPAGFDCSGFIQYTYRQAGISVPRTTHDQLRLSRNVKRSRLQPGDVIFFRLDGPKVSHVGIYIGGKRMIHAPSSGKLVSYARLDNGYWERHIVKTGRFY